MPRVANPAIRTSGATTSKGAKVTKTESQTLVAANSARVELYVSNPGTKDAYLALGSTAAKEEGIYLKKEGGGIIITGYTGIVTCVSSEGEGKLTFSEV